MMQSVALESNIINEDADYIFIQPEDMDIDDEASYDDCDEAINFPSSSHVFNVSSFRSTSKEPNSQNIIQSEFFREIESSASVVSLENLLEGKDINGTLSLEGSTTFFTDETLPSLDEVDVQMEITDSLSETNENQASLPKTTKIIILKCDQDVSLSSETSKNTTEKGGETEEDCQEKNSISTILAKTEDEGKSMTVLNSQPSKSRLSNKKRRKQMKKQKKEKAAESAANALAEMRSQCNHSQPRAVK